MMSRTESSVEVNRFNNLDGLSIAYINHKGIELPLKNVKDFSQAIKSAKCKGRNHLTLIFYDQKIKPEEATALNNSKCAIIGRFSKSQDIAIPCADAVSTSSYKAENICEGPLPEWFKQYMKKFKKEILKDLRSNISQMVYEEFEKEKKLTEEKLIKALSEENESSSPDKELKRRKRSSVKNSLDLLEKREVKLLKKIEKLCLSKFDRMMSPILQLEKLENKARAVLDEKKKLLERGCPSKSRNGKKSKEPEKQNLKSEKSAIFLESDVFLFLQPGAEFSVTVNIVNNGTIPWVSPRMECLSAPAVCLKDHLINLPTLEPGQSVSATLKGKVSQRLGNYYFLYQLFDGLEEFVGPLFTCFAVVSDSKEEVISNLEPLKPNCQAIPTGNVAGILVDFEKDVITSSQKKVKENINEIERRLQDIDLLRPCATGDGSREARLNNNAGEFEIIGCDLLQGEEQRYWKERSQNGPIFGVNPSQQKEETEKSKQMDGNVKSENSQTKKNGTESDSDSELSVIFMSEEEENFFFLPSLPESSNSEIVNNKSKLSGLYLNMESNKTNQKLKEEVVEGCHVKIELNEVGSESTSKNSFPRSSLTDEEEFSKNSKPSFESILTPTSAASPGVIFKGSLRENYPGNVPFRIFGETDFPPHNTPFNVLSNDSYVNRSLRGEISSSNYDQDASRVFHNPQDFTPFQDITTNNISNKGHRINIVPTSDCFGNLIYAVRNDGYCLPIKDVIQNEAGIPDDVELEEEEEEAQNEIKEETNINYKGNATEGSAVTTIPNVLMDHASRAFKAAKFVINNLHSALKPEVEITTGDIEKRKPPVNVPDNFPYNLYSMGVEERQYFDKLENQEKYLDARLTLHEMGFVNDHLNFYLLKKFDSEVINVINEILDMSLEETPQNVE